MSATTAPLITVYVRHTPGCKYSADETARRYPHLPLPQVHTTQAADYMSLLVEVCA